MRIHKIVILSLLLCFGALLQAPGQINAANFGSKNIEEEANARWKSVEHSGWINVISDNYIIIDDTSYVLTSDTQIPDGMSKLKEGEFVQFDLEIDNILSRVLLTTPTAADMHMKPIDRTSRSIPAADQESGNQSDSGNEDGVMRLENGVWVN